MKRITLFVCSLLLLATTLFTGCGSKGIVEFTTHAQEVRIATSSKAMTIDWGDGKTDSYKSTDTTVIRHKYANTDSHTVRMNADRLTLLWCLSNKLTALDVNMNKALSCLECSSNQLTVLDVSKNKALVLLNCESNQLTSLEVSRNKALTCLICYNNQLTVLDVSKNKSLLTLTCSANQLTVLDVSKNKALMWLACDKNKLTTLNVSRNTALEDLWCYENQLTDLDVSHNKVLWLLDCRENQLSGKALNALFSGLPAAKRGTIYIEDNPGSSACFWSIATKKGWEFKHRQK